MYVGRRIRVEFCMQSKLISISIKYTEIYIYDVLCKTLGNHRAKAYNRSIINKRKGIRAYHNGKYAICKDSKREERSKRSTKQPENN